MNKYVTKFNETGVSIVDVDMICKKWNNRFSISVWNDKYTIIIKGDLKTVISEGQAWKIIKRKELLNVKSPIFNSGSTYCTREFIVAQYDKANNQKEQKLKELEFINKTLATYSKAAGI